MIFIAQKYRIRGCGYDIISAMNIRYLIVALPLVVFSHSLVAMAAVPGNVRSVFPARGTETGPMGGARVSALADGAVRVDAGLKERWTGLVVKFTPYRELVEAARDIARRMYGLRYGDGR